MSYKEFSQCPICGDPLVKKRNDNQVLICECCGFNIGITRSISEIDKERLREANEALRSYEFDRAETRYSLIIDDINDSSNEVYVAALYGKLLSEFGIVYIKDVNGEMIPTFSEYNPEIKSIKYSYTYKSLLNSKVSYDTKSPYLEKIDELDKVYKRIDRELSENSLYDLFICTKISRKTPQNPKETGYTEDSKIADEFYYSLKESGLRVFYSQKDCGGIEYDSQILSALLRSKKILVIASQKEYLESPWVQSEWRRWINFIECGLKKEDSIYLYLPYYDKDSFELPRVLRKIQRFTSELNLVNLLTKKEEKKQKEVRQRPTSKYAKYYPVLEEIVEKHKKAIEKIVYTKKGYVYFGSYPQSKKKKNVIVTNQKKGFFYIGVDGNYYSKVNEDYFKVEPIKWKILYNYEGRMLLISDKILNSHSMSGNAFLSNTWFFRDHYFSEVEKRLIHGSVRLLKNDEFKNLLSFKNKFKKQTDYCKTIKNPYANTFSSSWALEDYKAVELENKKKGLETTVVTKLGKRKRVLVENNHKPTDYYGFVPVIELNNQEVKDLVINDDMFEEVTSSKRGKIFLFYPQVGDYITYMNSLARVSANDSSLQYSDIYSKYNGIIVDVHVKSEDEIDYGTKLLTMYCVDIFKKEK